jgi:hypothetical protein
MMAQSFTTRGRTTTPLAGENNGDTGAHPVLPLPLGETPLTDPRSLGSSAILHAVLLIAASFTVYSAVRPSASETRPVLQGEFDPVDNRADKTVSGEGGGSPGELGGLGSEAFLAPASGDTPQGAGLDPAADALLSEILPTTVQKPPEDLKRALPGPQTTGLGLIPGLGAGGGGGAGGGSGGGVGRGTGPGTEFFGAKEHGRSFAYVIDCSGSMSAMGALSVAKRELLASLNVLPPDVRFSVIFYNDKPRVFTGPSGQEALMPATAGNKARVQTQLQTIVPEGGTDHMLALRAALALKPEVIFFLTDADWMSDNNVTEILGEAGGSRIHTLEFAIGTDLGRETPLRRLATSTGATYRHINVTQFPRSAAGF